MHPSIVGISNARHFIFMLLTPLKDKYQISISPILFSFSLYLAYIGIKNHTKKKKMALFQLVPGGKIFV